MVSVCVAVFFCAIIAQLGRLHNVKMARPKTLLTQTAPQTTPDKFEVTIDVMSWLKEDFGHKGSGSLSFQETVSRSTSIMNLIRHLAEKFPKFRKKAFGQNQDMTEYCLIILNGKIISTAQLSQDLKPSDRITLSPAFYGG